MPKRIRHWMGLVWKKYPVSTLTHCIYVRTVSSSDRLIRAEKHNSLRYLQVGWVRSDSKAILSLHNSVITYDSRITLLRQRLI